MKKNILAEGSSRGNWRLRRCVLAMLEGIAHPQPLSLTLDVAAPESYPLADPWTHRSHPTRKTPPPTSATRASFLLFLPFFPFSFFAARWRGTSQGRIRMEWTPPRRCIPSFFPRTTRAPVLGGMVALFLFLLFSFPRFFERANGGERPTMFGLY